MPAKGSKVGDRVSQPQAFAIFVSKQTGKVGVRIAEKRAYASVKEVFCTATGLFITCGRDGLLIQGEGVVRQTDDTIAITG